MGTCLSTVPPRLKIGTSRRGSSFPAPTAQPSNLLAAEPPTRRSIHLPDNSESPRTKRRALLVGISYIGSTDPVWTPIDGLHDDVDRFRGLLIQTYGYLPEDIVVLKDDPSFPDQFHPTRANMVRELEWLVSGAIPGDKFTFLYIGHSDHQFSPDDDKEDNLDDVIITCDFGRIIHSELKHLLVNDLPIGCSLLAIVDTYLYGSMLDLPHYHCNNIYVPWLSKGDRRTATMHNKNMRNYAFDFAGRTIPTQSEILAGDASDLAGQPGSEKSESISSSRQPSSIASMMNSRRSGRSILSPTRYDSPISRVVCDGWCGYDSIPRATVVSLSARVDYQYGWEGRSGLLALTPILCKFLEKQPLPSYRTLMTHVNHQIHANCRALHNYSLHEKKKAAQREGPSFDGALNNFPVPQLSSLAKLNMDETLPL